MNMKKRYRFFFIFAILLALGNILAIALSNNWPSRVVAIVGCAGGTVAAITCRNLMKESVD